jgi:hypothetical protein
MTPSIPSSFVTLAAAVELAAEDWFPGQFLLTLVELAERKQTIEYEINNQYVQQPSTHGNAARKSLLHYVDIRPNLSSLARFEAIQEKLKDRQQLLHTVWRRFRQLLYWGELSSKVLTDSGQIVEIPACLWLGEFGNRAYTPQSGDDPIEQARVQLGDESFEGVVIVEAAELWNVISAPQLCRKAFRPVNPDHGENATSKEDGAEPKAETQASGRSVVQNVPPSTTPVSNMAHSGTGRKRAGRGSSRRMQATKVLSEIFPGGIPSVADMENKILVQQVRERLPEKARISDPTILRAAGRKC